MPEKKSKKFNPFSKMTSRELVGVEFGNDVLKIVHLRVTLHHVEVVNILSRSISGLSEVDVSKIVKNAFDELKVKDPYIIDIIASPLVITKNIEIPSIDPQEIKEIISLQAGRHTPYAREEIISDYINIGNYKNMYTKILLVIVARQIVRRHFEIMGKAGLEIEKVFFAPEAVAHSATNILKLDTNTTPISIVHLDANYADFAVVFKSRLIFLRSIPIGSQYITSERAYQIKFAEELERSLEAYQGEDIEINPNTVVLTGAVTQDNALSGALTETLHLPVKVVSYYRNFTLSEGIINKINTEKYTSFFTVIAPLLTESQLKMDFIPEEVRLNRMLAERARELIKTGILILAGLVILFSILMSKIYFKNAYLRKLNAKYKPINTEARGLEGNFTMVGLVKNYLSKRGYSLEVLAELYNIQPQELELSDIRFSDQTLKFNIRGSAESMPIVFQFVEKMEKSKYFKDVKTKYTTNRREGVKDLTDFEIVATLSKEGT